MQVLIIHLHPQLQYQEEVELVEEDVDAGAGLAAIGNSGPPAGSASKPGQPLDTRKLSLDDPKYRHCILCGDQGARADPGQARADGAQGGQGQGQGGGVLRHDWRFCPVYRNCTPTAGPPCRKCSWLHPGPCKMQD